MEILFLLIGLGFFLYIIFLIERSEEQRYNRKLNEMREFGYRKAKRKFLRHPRS